MNENSSASSHGGREVTAEAASRQQIADEHRALGELLGRLVHTTDPNALVPQLTELRRLLGVHFAREEADDGLYEIVGEVAPHLLSGVQRLFDEHRELAASVDELLATTRELCGGPLAEILAAVGGLAGRLHRHEAKENELVSGAFYDDLGISS